MRRLFVFSLGVLLLGIFAPVSTNACTCYDTDGIASSVSDYCKEACGGEVDAKELTDGVCSCSSESVAVSCIDVCEAKQLSVDPPASSSSADSASSKPLLTPALSIDIPGLTFTDALVRTNELGETVVSSNFLAEYITAVYTYLLGFATTIAIVMIMVGGLQWTISATSAEAIGKAKTRIKNAVTGLVLLLSTFLILYTVNPNLLKLQFPELTLIEEPEEEEDDVVSGTLATSFTTPTGSNISGKGVDQVPSELTSDIEAVAQAMADLGWGIKITSSYRSVETQKRLISENCQNPTGSSTCNPKPGSPTTCILKDLDPANCPHTTGRALDIWATEDGAQCITQSQCSKDPNTDACRANECQAALIQAMKDQGFCNLSIEAWHFEKPWMSTRCK